MVSVFLINFNISIRLVFLLTSICFNYNSVLVLSHNFVEFLEPYIVTFPWLTMPYHPNHLPLLFCLTQKHLKLGQHTSGVIVLTAEQCPVTWMAGEHVEREDGDSCVGDLFRVESMVFLVYKLTIVSHLFFEGGFTISIV